jgi:hypothetical protein
MSEYLKGLLLDIIRPVHDGLHAEYGVPASIEADCLSLAIKIQESGQTAVRDQGDPTVTGPATGLWQFERTGGVWECLNAPKIAPIFVELAERSGLRPVSDQTVWRYFTTPQSDDLAAAGARLVMYLDPAPLPSATLDAVQAALGYYLRRWRPAKNERREQDFVTKAWPQAVAIARANPRTPETVSAAPPTLVERPDRLEARVAELERRMAALGAALR